MDMSSSRIKHNYSVPLRFVFAVSLFFGAINSVMPTSAETTGQSTISGQIIDDAGSPLVFDVRIFKESIEDGRSRFNQVCSVETNADGVYTCSNLSEGRYALSAQPPNDAARVYSLKDPVYALTFYPGTSDLPAAQLIALNDHTEKWIVFAQHRLPCHHVRGRIAQDDRATHGAPALLVVNRTGAAVNTEASLSENSSSGLFTFDSVPNGWYVVRVRWFANEAGGHDVAFSEDDALVEVDNADVNDVHLVSKSSATLEGVIETDGTEQNPFVGSVLLQDLSGKQLQVSETVDTSRHFMFPVVWEGSYSIRLPSQNGECIQELNVDGRSMSDGQIPVASGRSHVLVELRLHPGVGAISGYVTDCGNSGSPCGVVARSEATGATIAVSTNKDGSFAINGVASGAYSLYAWRNLSEIPYADPGFLEKQGVSATTVAVCGGATVGNLRMAVLDEDR